MARIEEGDIRDATPSKRLRLNTEDSAYTVEQTLKDGSVLGKYAHSCTIYYTCVNCHNDLF